MTDVRTEGAGGVWTARDARPEDRPLLVKVFNEAFRRNDEAALLAWRYDANPHGSAWTVVAAGAAGDPVGSYSYVPRRFVLGGTESTAFQASDAMVLAEWQRKGIFRGLDNLLAERAAAAGVPFGFAFCGRRSQKGFLDNGWRVVSRYRTWTRVFRADAAAWRSRRSDGRWRQVCLPLEALRASRADPAIRQLVEGFTDELAAEFDDRFARAGAEDFGVVGARDASYLTWRYLATPRRTHRPFLLRRRGELVGYYDVETRADGSGFLVDAVGLDEASRRAAIASALLRLRSLGVSAVQSTVVEGSYLDRVVRDFGFEPPRERDILPFIVRVFVPGPLADRALDPRNWFVFDGDRDAEGMA